MQQRAHQKSLRQHLPVGCLSRTCFFSPSVSPVVLYDILLHCIAKTLHFVNGLFKSDKAEEEEAYVPHVWSFLSLSTRSSRSQSTSLVVAAIMYKRSSCIGCRVIHISKTNSHKEQTTTESEYSEAQVREGRRPTAEKKSGT